MATKKTKKPTEKVEEVEEVEEGKSEVIAFDEGSFNRAERKALQARFNRHFDDLLLYVDTGLVRRDVSFERDPDEPKRILTVLPPPAPDPIIGLDGAPVFADDVLIAMLTIVAKRENPGATEAMFDDYTTADLLRAIREGKAASRAKTTTG